MSDTITAEITARIALARQHSAATRDDIASAARRWGAPATFTAAALRNLESGRRCPTVEELLWLADALGVQVRQLLGEHAHLFGHDAYRPPECGRVEDATRTAVDELGDQMSGRQLALAEVAYALAADLDGKGEKRQPAQLSKAITDTLAAIYDLQPPSDEDDDGDDLGPE